jgi:hypothetical protein
LLCLGGMGRGGANAVAAYACWKEDRTRGLTNFTCCSKLRLDFECAKCVFHVRDHTGLLCYPFTLR